jgi:hypothetical protein
MEVSPPRDDVVVKIGETVDDRHSAAPGKGLRL